MTGPVDVAILTVIPAELRAALAALAIPDDAWEKDSHGTIYYHATVRSALQSHDYRVILTCIGMAGNPSASAATVDVIERYTPRAAILMGIAAGMRGKVKIGEVVLGERVVAYEPAALIQLADGTSQEQPRPEIERLSQTMQQDVVNYDINSSRLTQKFAAIGGTFPTAPAGQEGEYHQHVAASITANISTIASGEKLLRDPSKLLSIRQLHGKTEVGEMEASGFTHACRRRGIPWLIIRGISDFGDAFKNDTFHKFASRAAAVVLVDFLQYGLRLPLGSAHSEASSPPELSTRRSNLGLRLLSWLCGAALFILTAEITFRLLRYGADVVGMVITAAMGALTLLAILSLLPSGQRFMTGLAARTKISRGYVLWSRAPAATVALALVGLHLALPALAERYSDQGLIFQQNHQQAKALDQFQRAVSLNPSDAIALYNLGTAYEDLADFDRAEISYRAAIDIDPEFYAAYNNLGRILIMHKKDYEAALNYLNQARQRSPREPLVQYALHKNLGWALLGLANYRQAEAELRRALTLNQEGGAAYCLLAQVLEERPQADSVAAREAWANCLRYESSGDYIDPVQLERARERMYEGTSP